MTERATCRPHVFSILPKLASSASCIQDGSFDMVYLFGFHNQPPLSRQRATSISAGVIRLMQPGRKEVGAGYGIGTTHHHR